MTSKGLGRKLLGCIRIGAKESEQTKKEQAEQVKEAYKGAELSQEMYDKTDTEKKTQEDYEKGQTVGENFKTHLDDKNLGEATRDIAKKVLNLTVDNLRELSGNYFTRTLSAPSKSMRYANAITKLRVIKNLGSNISNEVIRETQDTFSGISTSDQWYRLVHYIRIATFAADIESIRNKGSITEEGLPIDNKGRQDEFLAETITAHASDMWDAWISLKRKSGVEDIEGLSEGKIIRVEPGQTLDMFIADVLKEAEVLKKNVETNEGDVITTTLMKIADVTTKGLSAMHDARTRTLINSGGSLNDIKEQDELKKMEKIIGYQSGDSIVQGLGAFFQTKKLDAVDAKFGEEFTKNWKQYDTSRLAEVSNWSKRVIGKAENLQVILPATLYAMKMRTALFEIQDWTNSFDETLGVMGNNVDKMVEAVIRIHKESLKKYPQLQDKADEDGNIAISEILDIVHNTTNERTYWEGKVTSMLNNLTTLFTQNKELFTKHFSILPDDFNLSITDPKLLPKLMEIKDNFITSTLATAIKLYSNDEFKINIFNDESFRRGHSTLIHILQMNDLGQTNKEDLKDRSFLAKKKKEIMETAEKMLKNPSEIGFTISSATAFLKTLNNRLTSSTELVQGEQLEELLKEVGATELLAENRDQFFETTANIHDVIIHNAMGHIMLGIQGTKEIGKIMEMTGYDRDVPGDYVLINSATASRQGMDNSKTLSFKIEAKEKIPELQQIVAGEMVNIVSSTATHVDKVGSMLQYWANFLKTQDFTKIDQEQLSKKDAENNEVGVAMANQLRDKNVILVRRPVAELIDRLTRMPYNDAQRNAMYMKTLSMFRKGILFGPTRVFPYNLNNMIGDIVGLIMTNPERLRDFSKGFRLAMILPVLGTHGVAFDKYLHDEKTNKYSRTLKGGEYEKSVHYLGKNKNLKEDVMKALLSSKTNITMRAIMKTSVSDSGLGKALQQDKNGKLTNPEAFDKWYDKNIRGLIIGHILVQNNGGITKTMVDSGAVAGEDINYKKLLDMVGGIESELGSQKNMTLEKTKNITKKLTGIWTKTIDMNINVSTYLETGRRLTVALGTDRIYNKRFDIQDMIASSGQVNQNINTNKYLFSSGVDSFYAAAELANETLGDYSNIWGATDKAKILFPFLSFYDQLLARTGNSIKNTMLHTYDGLVMRKYHSPAIANRYLLNAGKWGALTPAVMMGLTSALWNYLMQLIGLKDEDDVPFDGSGILGFEFFKLHNGYIWLPWGNSKSSTTLDIILGSHLNTSANFANTLFEYSPIDIESIMQATSASDFFTRNTNATFAKTIGKLNPVIKYPFEALNNGTYYSTGFVASPNYTNSIENAGLKVLNIFGLTTAATGLHKYVSGALTEKGDIENEYSYRRVLAARNDYTYGSLQSYEPTELESIRTLISTRVKSGDVAQATELFGQYANTMRSYGKTEEQIQSGIRSMVRNSLISGSLSDAKFNEFLTGLTAQEQTSLSNAVKFQNTAFQPYVDLGIITQEDLDRAGRLINGT